MDDYWEQLFLYAMISFPLTFLTSITIVSPNKFLYIIRLNIIYFWEKYIFVPKFDHNLETVFHQNLVTV